MDEALQVTAAMSGSHLALQRLFESGAMTRADLIRHGANVDREGEFEPLHTPEAVAKLAHAIQETLRERHPARAACPTPSRPSPPGRWPATNRRPRHRRKDQS